MKIFKKILRFLITVALIVLLIMIWRNEWSIIEKILFTLIVVVVKFLDIVYTSFKNFIDAENSRVRMFTSHVIDEYNEFLEENVSEVDSGPEVEQEQDAEETKELDDEF